jgi:putative transcriptional regulator
MKKCDVCGSELESRRTARETPYAYAIGGLPRVGLVGIVVHRCATCNIEAPVIPKPAELHGLLARMFLRKAGVLAGDELRFLRKHAGFSAQKFAEMLGVDP